MIETGRRIFLDACGLSSALTLECDDPGLPAASSMCHEHGLPFVVVGRDPRSDFHLNDPLISRRHAYLQVIAGRIFCIDLESRSQIRWDGADDPATKRWLEQDQFIWLGRYRLRWRGRLGKSAQDAEIVDPLSSHPFDQAAADHLPAAEIELPIRIGETLSSWKISPRLSLIGRSAECQLVLTDDSVSTYHASLVRTPLGIWVVDMLSRQGVWVNGTRVRWAWLDDGDTLRVGRFAFVLRYRSVCDQISRQDVPLDAGAIFSPYPVAAPAGSPGLSMELAKSPTRRSSQLARSRTEFVPYSAVVAPRSVASVRGDEWNPVPTAAAGPIAMWNQHIQFLEMLHSEMILMVRMFMTMHQEHVGAVRYQDAMFPTSRFRRAYDTLLEHSPGRAAKDYLRILELAAKESETGVDAVLGRLLEWNVPITPTVVADHLAHDLGLPRAMEVMITTVDLSIYDGLLETREELPLADLPTCTGP